MVVVATQVWKLIIHAILQLQFVVGVAERHDCTLLQELQNKMLTDIGHDLKKALDSLDGDLKGKYYALKSMTDAEQQQLIDDHFLFDKPVSPLLLASGMARDWPDARGIW
ncbi:hypothetical protein AB205_0000390 [Aquarana catesbeiana]|uniref:creatine kinase n=1 Tax=Aquarana catesbeiana TaxID=8400 RepID=A0A2G9QFA3_AQUCT|nr:hypothetical protein AB205_0000390 [Aquarana catesbeiana]